MHHISGCHRHVTSFNKQDDIQRCMFCKFILRGQKPVLYVVVKMLSKLKSKVLNKYKNIVREIKASVWNR